MKKTLCAISLLFLFSRMANAQITVNGGLTATQLANMIAGSNIVVSNATLSGSVVAAGSFNAPNNNLGMNAGVILSTGSIYTAPGPNLAGNTSDNLGMSGTAQMTAIAGTQTYDAITLEFDFTVQSPTIQFNYIFASEEYPEYAPPNSSPYNDVFAFFISGPGISGEQNIALIPNTALPVSIHNVNIMTNSQYYIDNTGGQAISFDAYTSVLTAKKNGLIPCQTYHLKLVIADAGDAVYNSAVFLQANSLVQGNVDVTTNTVNSDNIALEGCIKASFTFSIDQPLPYNKEICYKIAGTATNGIDYALIDTCVTIPAGQTHAKVFINAFDDGIPEGTESIYIIYKPSVCSPADTAFLYIHDNQSINYTLTPTSLTCNDDHSGQILVNATGGFPPYTFHVKDNTGNTTLYTTNPITGLNAGNYTVYVYDSYGCKADALVIGGLFNAGTTFLPDGNGVTYTTSIPISGFHPGATLSNMNMLQNVCLNMEHSYLGDLLIRLQSPSGQSVILKEFPGDGSCDLGEPIATGPIDGWAGSLLTDPGVGYDYCFNANPMHGTMVGESGNYYRNYTDGEGHNYSDNYLPAGSYTSYQSLSNLLGSTLNGNWTIYVTDNYYLDNGYIFNWTISLVGDMPDTLVTLNQPAPINMNDFVTNATCGNSNGIINLSVNGDFPPFSYHWSTGATSQDLSGVPAGVYSVTVTDAHNCSHTASYLVSNSGTLALSANITPVYCSGGSTGAINITPSGGTLPYTYLWSNGHTTEDISSLVSGNYTITMTDNIGCQLIRQFTVSTNPPIQINLISQHDEQCGTHNGSITVAASGGSGSFGYHWNTGATNASITGLSAGNYMVTVTDGYGCTAIQTYTVINDVSNCSMFCYLDVIANSITDELCGNGHGAIDVSIIGATLPYIVSWSTGASIEDITGLHQGSYTITVTDANQCVKVKTFTVGNNTGNLIISNYTVNNEICGTGNGSIEITVSGGAMPYQYSWSNAAHTQDITDLVAFNYTVTVTDANNCNLIATYTVQNNTGNLSVTGTVNDAFCSGNNGSIFQTVSGGFGLISYVWSNGATTQNLTNIPAGNYICNIMDGGGCSLVKTYTVQNFPGNLSVDNINVTNETCGNGHGAIHLIVSGTSPIYHWNTGTTTQNITNLHAGAYSCTIHNNGGCQITTGTIHVFNSAGDLSVTLESISDEICGNGNGSVTVNVSGGTQPYTYFWSNGSGSQDIYSLHAGNYTLTVTDSNGCQYVYSATVQNEQGTLAIGNAIVTNETCGHMNGAINLIITGGTTPYTYHWSNGALTQNLSGLHAGTYTVTVTSGEGCTATDNVVVANIANGMALSWQVTNEICSNGQGAIDLTVTGGAFPYIYLWSNLATTEDISGLQAGTYSCTVTDNMGCNDHTGNIVVNNHANNMTATTAVTNEICGNAQGAINLTITGGAHPFQYHWSNSATTEDITGLTAGTYSYTVTDNNNCTLTGSALVNNNTSGNMNFTVHVIDEHCSNGLGVINLTVTGGISPITYHWNNLQSTQDIDSLHAGNYSCTVTDHNGCTLIAGPFTVANNPGTLQIVSMVVSDEVCSNHHGSIDLTVSGGTAPYTFNWSNGAHTEDIVNISAGIYIVNVIDSNNCSITGQSVVVNQSGAFNITAYYITDEHCFNGQGSIDITVQGGLLPYTYIWSNGATTQDISSLSAGTYTVYTHDASGCSVNESYSIQNEGGDFQITNAVITDEICNSGAGAISITVTGGSPPFLFHWSNGANTEDITSLHAGHYSVTVQDIYGCVAYRDYDVSSVPGSMVISGSATDEYCGDGQGSVVLNVSGGASPYFYSWSNGAVTEDIYHLHAGAFSVTITDVTGCTGNYSGTVLNNTNGFNATVSSITEEMCGNHNGSITVDVTGGALPYSYHWNTGATTQNLNNAGAGTYTLQVSDVTGCTLILQASVTNNTGSLVIGFTHVQDENCGMGDGYINIEVSGGASPYSYHWSNGALTQDISDLSQGNYTVTITDNLFCQLVQTFHVSNANSTNIQISGIVTDEVCWNHNGSIDITVTGGLLPLITQWSNGSLNQDQSHLTAGTYIVVVSDDGGCSNSESFTVHMIIAPPCDTVITSVNDYGQGRDAAGTETERMTVFPNPAGNSVTVDYLLQKDISASLRIYNIEKQTVYISTVTGKGKQQIMTSSFAPGVYNVAIMNDRVYLYKKLVIVR